MDVSVIIVNYNTRVLLDNCLKSVYDMTHDVEFEIIVSDNGSRDGSIQMLKDKYPQVILIENNANLGFGTACNRGVKIARGKYIFYLNSDTILLNNAIKYFYDYWESCPYKDTIGALGSNLVDADKNLMHSFGVFNTVHECVRDRYHRAVALTVKSVFKILKKSWTKYTKKQIFDFYTGEVGFITGADLFVKNDENALFDENIFLYGEDSELQYRMKLKGLSRLIIDGPKIMHLEGQSDPSKNKDKTDLVAGYASFGEVHGSLSLVYFTKKYFGSFNALRLKIATFILWINPVIFSHTRKYIKALFKV